MKNQISPQYIAGLIDGEGCFDFNLTKKYFKSRLRVSVVERDSHILDLLHEQYGGTIQRIDTGKTNHSPQRMWYLERKRLDSLLEDILPYLIIKKKHAQLIKEFSKLPLEERYSKEIKILFKQKLSKLNKRGRL